MVSAQVSHLLDYFDNQATPRRVVDMARGLVSSLCEWLLQGALDNCELANPSCPDRVKVSVGVEESEHYRSSIIWQAYTTSGKGEYVVFPSTIS